MKKGLIFIVLIFAAIISTAADRSLTIAPGYTMLNRFTLNASDTITTSATVTYSITNLQKYMQHQVFTVALTTVSGSPSVTITAQGRVTSTSAWVTIGTPITWTTTGNNGSMASVDPYNYNYLRVTFVASGATQLTKITGFEVKTANAYDIPANSGTLTISRATTGVVTVTTKDDDANAATVYRAGGTGALTLGSAAGTTAITSSDWAISATGDQTGMGAATFDGLVTATAGLSFATGSTVFWAKGGVPTAVTTGTDVAASAGARWWVEIEIPHNATITGLSYLVGSVGGTDSVMVHLYNSAGTQVATSKKTGAAHGDLVGTAAQLQSVAFTAPYAAVAGKYFAAVQFNGTTAKFRAYLIPGSKFVANTAAGTYDTAVASITPGSTFVADKGPVISTY